MSFTESPQHPGTDNNVGMGTAFDVMTPHTQSHKASQAWKKFALDNIRSLKRQYLSVANVQHEVRLYGKRGNKWTLVYKIGEDPTNAVFKMFLASKRVDAKDTERIGVLNELLKLIAAERNKEGSNVRKLYEWEMDLKLRALRKEIDEKLNRGFVFFLQHTPPEVFEPRTSFCVHPNCQFHVTEQMPPDYYRVEFLDVINEAKRRNRELMEEETDDLGPARKNRPGRGKDGKMWFCLTCLQDLCNGVGLIKSVRDDGVAFVDRSSKTPLWVANAGHIQLYWEEKLQGSVAGAVVPSTIDYCKAPNDQDVEMADVDQPKQQSCSGKGIWSLNAASSRQTSTPDDDNSVNLQAKMEQKKGKRKRQDTDSEEEEEGGFRRVHGPSRAKYPQPPHYGSLTEYFGLDNFAVQMASFIQAELRHTSTEFYTLNSHETLVLRAWKKAIDLMQRSGDRNNQADYAPYKYKVLSNMHNDPYMVGEWLPDNVNHFPDIYFDYLKDSDMYEDLHHGHLYNAPVGAAGTSHGSQPGASFKLKGLHIIMDLVNTHIKRIMEKEKLTFSLHTVNTRFSRLWPPESYWLDANWEEFVLIAMEEGGDLARKMEHYSDEDKEHFHKASQIVIRRLEEDKNLRKQRRASLINRKEVEEDEDEDFCEDNDTTMLDQDYDDLDRLAEESDHSDDGTDDGYKPDA